MAGEFDPIVGTPTAYGYIRVSHHKSYEKGDSMEAQAMRIGNYYEANLKSEGVAWGGTEEDGTNISAYKVPFHIRPAGRKLLAKLKRGDHLIVDKVDRFWRSITDFVGLMETLKEKKITVHIVNFLGQTVKNTTPMGEFTLRLFVLVAELESTIKAERMRETLAVKRHKGQRICVNLPIGTELKIVKFADGSIEKQIHWSKFKRLVMGEILRLKDTERLTNAQIVKLIRLFAAKYILAKRKKYPNYDPTYDREWMVSVFGRRIRMDGRNRSEYHGIVKHYNAEAAYRYLGVKETCQIPGEKIVTEAARQWKRVQRERNDKRLKEMNWPHSRSKEIPVIPAEDLLKAGGMLGVGTPLKDIERGKLAESTQYYDPDTRTIGHPGKYVSRPVHEHRTLRNYKITDEILEEANKIDEVVGDRCFTKGDQNAG